MSAIFFAATINFWLNQAVLSLFAELIEETV